MRQVRVIAEAGMCDNSVQYAIEAARQAKQVGCWGFKVQMLNPKTLNTSWIIRRESWGFTGPAAWNACR